MHEHNTSVTRQLDSPNMVRRSLPGHISARRKWQVMQADLRMVRLIPLPGRSVAFRCFLDEGTEHNMWNVETEGNRRLEKSA